MNLVFRIALTHVRARARQTLVAVAGVATGVGFSIMMAAMLQGSQQDFIRQLINAMPHVTVSDERRKPTPQPSETFYDSAEIHGLTPQARRRGIKNPLATMASLEGWVPGAVAPSAKVQAILRYASRDVGASIIGIEPRRETKVSNLSRQLRQGTLPALYRATNAMILGDGLAEKIGARVGSNITVQTSEGVRLNAQVVGLFHSGVRAVDESTAYTLVKTGQILSQQIGLVNEIRLRLADALAAPQTAARIERETGYKSVAWQEASEDLLNAFVVRNVIMYTVVGAILLVASFGTYNIISTITHEKARDIAIMKSFGMKEGFVRSIFLVESMIIGGLGIVAGWVMGYLLCWAVSKITYTNPLNGETQAIYIYYALAYYLAIAGVALISCTGAAYIPVRKATRVHPVDIIRGAA